ncbi:MAG: hypothetical protein ACKVP5_16340 [Aestuariivirga sp.]
MTNPYWFNYWCGKDANCLCRVRTGIETDIPLVYDLANGQRLGVHVEVKRPGESLGDGQAESYPRRAACWANPKTKPGTVPAHHVYSTILACDRELARDKRIDLFDKIAFHHDIAKWIEPYPE